MDILVLLAVFGAIGVGWRVCAELRRIREALEQIACAQEEMELRQRTTVSYYIR